MRLYVNCKSCGRKIYLSINVNSRKELMSKLGGRRFRVKCPYCSHEKIYDVNDVIAEPGSKGAFTLLGALLGAAFAELGGLIVGGFIGALIDAEEERKAKEFNQVIV